MGTEQLLIFHPLTIFLVLAGIWVIGGPFIAWLVSHVVANVINDFMEHPTMRFFALSARADVAADGEDQPVKDVIREKFIEMSRGIFLLYGGIGLILIPTFILIFLSEVREPSKAPPFGLFLTSIVNLLIVAGVVVGSHAFAIMLRDRNYERLENANANGNGRNGKPPVRRSDDEEANVLS